MFAVGDMHASMGDGEICGTGVEIEGEVVVRFGLPRASTRRGPCASATATGSRTAPRRATTARRSRSRLRKRHGCSSTGTASASKRRSSSCPSPATSASARPASRRRSARSPGSSCRRSRPVVRRSD